MFNIAIITPHIAAVVVIPVAAWQLADKMHALEQVQSVPGLILLKNKSFKVGIRFIKSTETILPGIEKSWSGKGVTKVLKPHSFSQIESVDYALASYPKPDEPRRTWVFHAKLIIDLYTAALTVTRRAIRPVMNLAGLHLRTRKCRNNARTNKAKHRTCK